MERSLVLMPNWIGDFVVALSVVLHKARTENADMTILAPAPLIPLCTLLCGLPVMAYKRKTRKEFRSTVTALRKGGFKKIYILPPSFSSAWCAYRSGVPKRRGVSRELRGVLLTDALPASLRNVSQHITYEYSLVLQTDYRPPQYWEPDAIDPRREYVGALVVCPGSKYGPAKRWPWFAELIKQMPGTHIVLLGGPEDIEAGERAKAAAAPGRVENLIGKTSLAQAAAIIAGARVVISNDSGLMHLAGFLGTPVVGIFGSTSPDWTRPLGKKTFCAKINCSCSPCFRKTCRYGHYDCLNKLSPDFVASAAAQLINTPFS